MNYINKRAVGLLGLRTGCGLKKFEMQNLKEFEHIQRRESECLGERRSGLEVEMKMPE